MGCPQLIFFQPKGKYLLVTSGMVKAPARGKAGCPHRSYPGHPWTGQALCSTSTQLLEQHGQTGKLGTTAGSQGSCGSRVSGALGELLECNQKTNELWWNKVKFGKVCICPRNAVWAIRSLQPPTGSSAVWFRCSAKASHHWPDSLGEYLQKTNQIIN